MKTPYWLVTWTEDGDWEHVIVLRANREADALRHAAVRAEKEGFSLPDDAKVEKLGLGPNESRMIS